MNRIITGTLTSEPEIRYTKDETPIAKFTVDVKNIKDKKDSFNCIAWRELATVAEKYLKEGSLVAIEGKLTINPYVSKGLKKTKTFITVDNMLMLDKIFFESTEQAKKQEDLLS